MDINNVGQGRQNIGLSDYPSTNQVSSRDLSNYDSNVKKTDDKNSEAVNLNNLKENDVKDIADGLNKLIEHTDTHVEYEKHDVFNEYIIKIIDDETGDVLKEIPPKKILDMIAKMCENLGIFMDKRA